MVWKTKIMVHGTPHPNKSLAALTLVFIARFNYSASQALSQSTWQKI